MKIKLDSLRIYRDVFEYSPLSFGAKGILGYLLFNEEDYVEMIKIYNDSKEEPEDVDDLIKELNDEGYLIVEK